ncbi:AraC family transcriptional regulator [Bowmanella pacifica]|uniref:AraC family transcriptional regulator n=1 Tax=Bowmanella pacifica TaxID=502051 RepID=A0A917YZC2_9ALTE|nr:AraC family transcriptional regulator [Bowmanella pacifica]GGO70610.1 AraC family transcriptional regulator [Bowmanella pacifica]
MHLVRSGAAAHFEQLVLEYGQNPIEIIRQAGLHQVQFRDPNTYIAHAKLATLLEIAAQRCQQPLFGLALAQRQRANVLGDLPMLVSRAATVAEALEWGNRYVYLHAGGVSLQIVPRGDSARLSLSLDLPVSHSFVQLMQMSVAQMAIFVSGLLNTEPRAMTLYLRQAQPIASHTSLATPLPTIRFEQDFDGIVLTTAQLASRNHHDDEALNRHLTAYLAYLQNHYPDNLAAQTKEVIGRLLPTGECSIDRVATALGMHERTLQMRLKAAEVSYSLLLREVRQNMAEQQLRFGSQSITELALQLGYAEVAVFSRHFRQWTGQSPRQWQKTARQLS